MKGKTAVLTLYTMFFFLITFSVSALDIPPLQGRVNDRADVLSQSEEQELNRYLESVEKSSGAQLVVLTIPSLEGDSLEMFALKTAREWELGEADKNNGLLLLVAMEERKLRIEVGYGLEGDITDAQSGYIIRNIITPHFKRGNFGEGILEGMKTLGGLALGDTELVVDERASSEGSAANIVSILPFFIFILIFIIRIKLTMSVGRRGRRGLFWTGVSTGSRSSGSGFSSGGFSGGGGSFGGGGSSGSW